MSTPIGDLVAKLRLDNSEFKREVRGAEDSLKTLKRVAVASLAGWASVAGIRAFWGTLLDSVEDYQMAVTQTAALLTGMTQARPGQGLAEHYSEAKQYAEGLVSAMEQIDAKTILSAKDLQTMNMELVKQRQILDVNNEKQVQGFTNLANAVAVISAGSANKELQLRQEVGALLRGEVNQNAQLATMLNAQVGNLKEQIELHKQQGDLIEWLGEQLAGFGAAGKDLENSWSAIGSTMETIYRQTIREGLTVAFNDILKVLRDISDWAKEHQHEIEQYVRDAWIGVRDVTLAVWENLRDISKAISDFADEHPVLTKVGGEMMKLVGYAVALRLGLGLVRGTIGGLASLAKTVFGPIAAATTGVVTALFAVKLGAIGALGGLQLLGAAAGAVFAYFVGWKIGEIIGQEFSAGIQKAIAWFDKLLAHAKYIWDRILDAAKMTWDGFAAMAKQAIAGTIILLDNVPGLMSDSLVGWANDAMTATQKVLDNLQASYDQDVAASKAARDRKIADIDAIIGMIDKEEAARTRGLQEQKKVAEMSGQIRKVAAGIVGDIRGGGGSGLNVINPPSDPEAKKKAKLDKEARERQRALDDFDRAYRETMYSEYQNAMYYFNEEVEAFEKAGIDKERLAEWSKTRLAQINKEFYDRDQQEHQAWIERKKQFDEEYNSAMFSAYDYQLMQLKRIRAERIRDGMDLAKVNALYERQKTILTERYWMEMKNYGVDVGGVSQKRFSDYLSATTRDQKEHIAEMIRLQNDWADAALLGLDEYAARAQAVGGMVENAMTSALYRSEDALVDFVTTGKADFNDLANSIIADLVRIYMRSQVLGPIAQAIGGMGGLGGLFGALFSGGSTGPIHLGAGGTTAFGMAQGGVMPGISGYRNSILTNPTWIPLAAGGVLAGEAGSEAVIPLTRMGSGNLGVEAKQPGPMVINIHEAPGTKARVEQDDDRDLNIIIEQVEGSISGRMSRGAGLASFMDGRYRRKY